MECQLTAVIYAFRSPGSGATYIGKHQCSPEGWPRRGTGCLPDGYRGSGVVVGHFHRRHGAAVQWRILAVVDGGRDAVNAAERRAIRLARGALGRKCVNKADGGDGQTREAALLLSADPDWREKVSTGTKAAWANPEVRAKQSAAQKLACARPEVHAKRVAAAKAAGEVSKTPEAMAKARETRAKPEFKARHSKAMKDLHARPEVKAKMSAAIKEAKNRPEARAAIREKQKAITLTPEGAAALARAQAAGHTPEAIAKQKDTRARNKALREARA